MAQKEEMDPPFFTGRQAIGFAAVLAFFLLLPLLLGKTGMVTRRDVYAAVPDRWGSFSYIHQQIFAERAPIDVAIFATSFLYQAIDAPYLEEQLSRRLGRKANVVTFASNWRCDALNYALLRDVLQHRKVGLVLFSMPVEFQKEIFPHPQSFRWWLYGEDDAALRGLPAEYRWNFHAETVLGSPRHLLSLVRQDRFDDRVWAASRGTVKAESGIYPASFVRFTPDPPRLSADSMIYAPGSGAPFQFSGHALTDYQMHYLRLSFELLRQQGVPVSLLHVPLWPERHDSNVKERMLWPQVFGADMTLIGAPPARLFGKLTDSEIELLYYLIEPAPRVYLHMNRNGSEYFTRAVTPAIVETYVKHTSH